MSVDGQRPLTLTRGFRHLLEVGLDAVDGGLCPFAILSV